MPGQLFSASTSTSSGSVTTGYRYDADGNLLLQQDGSVTTLYLPGEDLTANGSTVTATRYYTFDGRVVAVAVPNSGGGSKLVSWLFSIRRARRRRMSDCVDSAADEQLRRQGAYAGRRSERPGSGAAAWPGTRGFARGDGGCY